MIRITFLWTAITFSLLVYGSEAYAQKTPPRQIHALYKLWGKIRPTLFDPVAVTLSFHEAFCRIEELRLEVDAEGFTRERDGQPNARVATSIRTDDFLSWYVERIVNRKLK